MNQKGEGGSCVARSEPRPPFISPSLHLLLRPPPSTPETLNLWTQSSERARGGVGDGGVGESSGGSNSVWRQPKPSQDPLFERARRRGRGKEARQWPAVLDAGSSWAGLRWTPGARLVLASKSSIGHGREEESNQWQSNRNPSCIQTRPGEPN